MKKSLILCLLFSVAINQAQTFNITTGAEFTGKNGAWTNELFEADSHAFFSLNGVGGYYSTRYVLRKFDVGTAKMLFEKQLDFSGNEYLGGKAYFIKGFYNNGKILIFSQSTKLKENLLMMQEFSSETGEPLGKPMVVEELINTKAYIISEALLKFEVSFSPDNKKMLIVAELKQNQKAQKVMASLYDVNGYKKIWQKEPTEVYQNSTVSSFNYCVDNAGNLSYLIEYLKFANEKNNTSREIGHAVGMCPANSQQHKMVDILTKQLTTKKPKLEIINGMLVCTGLCNGESEYGKPFGGNKKVGFFLLTLDPSRGVLRSQTFDFFSPDIHEKLSYKDKGFVNIPAGSKHYFNFKTLWHKGSIYQIWQRVIDQDYESCQGMEVLVYKYNAEHKLEWMKLLPRSTAKKLTAMNYVVGNNIHLLYYENPKNLEKFPDLTNYDATKYKQATSAKTSALVLLTIDAKGKATRQLVHINEANRLLESENYETALIKDQNTLIVPVEISSSVHRYDLFKLGETN